jgi:site-specific recombinase XerD
VERPLNDIFYLTHESIQEFLMFLRRKNRKSSTISSYEGTLEMLYSFLPPDKAMQKDTISKWQQFMVESGFSCTTIESRISTANRFVIYLGKADWCAPHVVSSTAPPELTRQDYKNLLQAAQREGNRTAYMIIKTLCCAGMSFLQLSKITVSSLENYRDGFPTFSIHPGKEICIPAFLREELLEYAQEMGIRSGFFFSNRYGKPYSSGELCNLLRPVFHAAEVTESKLSSRAFQKLYHKVFDKIYYQFISQVHETYTDFLLEEEASVKWKTNHYAIQ